MKYLGIYLTDRSWKASTEKIMKLYNKYSRRSRRLPGGSAVFWPPNLAGAKPKPGLGLLAHAAPAGPGPSPLSTTPPARQRQDGSSIFEITRIQLFLDAHGDVQDRTRTRSSSDQAVSTLKQNKQKNKPKY